MDEKTQPTVLRLFLTFLRLGVTAFGGPAMVAYIRREAVERRHWMEQAEFDDGVALCQMLPGATAMQTAAFVGLVTRGLRGAAASFIGFGLPAFVIMLGMSALYAHTHTWPSLTAAFKGWGAIIVAIVVNAAWSFGERSLRDWRRGFIAAAAAVLFAWGVHPFLVIALAAVAGLTLNVPAQSVVSVRREFSRGIWLFSVVAAAGLVILFFVNRPMFELSVLMARIDLFAFGGGYASVPLMLHEVVRVRHWMDDATFMNGIALGQITPGPIVITATFVGYLVKGLAGALVATVSVFLPSFLLVVMTTPHFGKLSNATLFNRIIAGVLCSFVGLLLSVAVRFATQVDWDITRVLLMAAALIALRLRLDILWIMLAGTAASVILLG